MTQNLVPRHKQKLITDDTVAIRKLRELRRYSRTQAGILFGLSGKQVEAIENGRVQLTDARIELSEMREGCALILKGIESNILKSPKLNLKLFHFTKRYGKPFR